MRMRRIISNWERILGVIIIILQVVFVIPIVNSDYFIQTINNSLIIAALTTVPISLGFMLIVQKEIIAAIKSTDKKE